MEINPDTLEIEIVDVEPIDGGVQVFARAWSDGEQIGFGVDGTVDIERFRIFNPPVLVPDPLGEINVFQEADLINDIPEYNQNFRYDPAEATLQSIEHTIGVMNNKVLNSSTIVPGKRGNTTSTFYPDAGTGGTTVDGQINRGTGGTSWSDLRTGTGTGAFPSLNPIAFGYLRSTTTTDQYNLMVRGFFTFNTASIPDSDVISSATFSTYVTSVSGTTNFGTLSSIVTKWTLAANNNLATGDYNISNIGTSASSGKGFDTFSTSAYNDYAITDLTSINKTGVTSYATLTTAEVNNVAPTWASNVNAQINCSAADNTGTSQDPKLVVEHAASATFTPRIIMY